VVEGGVRPEVTSTYHVLPFHSLSGADFERLCLALLRARGYRSLEHWGAAGRDHGCDIVGCRDRGGATERVVVQCKRVSSTSAAVLVAEVDKVATAVHKGEVEQPDVMIFIVTANLSADARAKVVRRCADVSLRCEVLALTELEAEVWSHPDIVNQFFGARRRLRPIVLRRRGLLAGSAAGLAVASGAAAWLSLGDDAPAGVLDVQQRLDLPGVGAMVLASAVHDGAPSVGDGCDAMTTVPDAWDPVTDHFEVMFHVRPRRDDVTLVGFEVTRSAHSELGDRIGLSCEAGVQHRRYRLQDDGDAGRGWRRGRRDAPVPVATRELGLPSRGLVFQHGRSDHRMGGPLRVPLRA
jgi:hypothetical protein